MHVIPNKAKQDHNKLKLTLLLFTCFLFINLQTLNASTVIALDDNDLVKNASIVIYARIGSSESQEFNTRIATKHHVEVIEMIKGEKEPCYFLTRGGQVGDFIYTTTGEPSFEKNQEAILFLEPVKAYQDELLLLGLAQGAIYVDDVLETKGKKSIKKEKRIRRAQNKGIQVKGSSNDENSKNDNQKLDNYLKKIRNIAKAETKNSDELP